jgi:hypothetical protein
VYNDNDIFSFRATSSFDIFEGERSTNTNKINPISRDERPYLHKYSSMFKILISISLNCLNVVFFLSCDRQVKRKLCRCVSVHSLLWIITESENKLEPKRMVGEHSELLYDDLTKVASEDTHDLED